MRWLAILIFASLLFSVLVPQPTPPSVLSDGRTAVAALDVCHSHLSLLTDDDDMPGAVNRPGFAMPVAFVGCCRENGRTILQLLLAARDEDPPEAQPAPHSS